MAAEYSLLFISNNSSKWHLLEGLIDLGKHTVWIVDVFSESLGTLISESEIFIDVFIFVITSQEHNLFWIFQLKCEEEADNFQTILTLIDIVTQEEIIESMDISGIKRSLPDIKESHEIYILTMNISDDFYWWSDFLDNNWLSSQDLSALVSKLNDVLSLAWELSPWLDFLTFFWLQERF